MFKKIFEKKMEEAEAEIIYPPTIKYRDTLTSKVYEVPNTFDNFDKIMSNKNNQLIFE